MKETTTQKQLFLMGVELVEILSKTTQEKFEQYRAEFMSRAEGRPTTKEFIDTVFNLAETKRREG